MTAGACRVRHLALTKWGRDWLLSNHKRPQNGRAGRVRRPPNGLKAKCGRDWLLSNHFRPQIAGPRGDW